MKSRTVKTERALARLTSGHALFRLMNGQWKFGGNKFVPGSVVQRLPIEEVYTNNLGMTVFRIDPKYLAQMRRDAGNQAQQVDCTDNGDDDHRDNPDRLGKRQGVDGPIDQCNHAQYDQQCDQEAKHGLSPF